MAEPATAEQQGANSPARQLLAALTKASQEMEKSVAETYEFVSKLNSELERVVNAQLSETAEKTEMMLRGHLTGITAEKEEILSKLTELRQEELKVLQGTGRELRLAIVEKLDGLVTDFKSDVDEHLRLFQEQLENTESETSSSVEAIRNSLREQIPQFLKSIEEEVGNEQSSMDEMQTHFVGKLNQESTVSLTQLQEHASELKSRLDQEGQEFLSSVDLSADELIARQTAKLQQRIESFSQMEQVADQRIASLTATDINYINELPNTFSSTSEQMAELHVGLHATIVKNLALQYRTEILSAAQEAEDQLQIVRGDLQSMMRHYQNHYAELFSSLLSKFEKASNEMLSSQTASRDDSKNTQQALALIQEQFGGIKKVVSECSRDKISETENTMEKAYEEFRVKLDNARKNAADKVESSFKQSQDELGKMQQNNEDNLQEMSMKIDELEQAINEAKELIKALDQASLDF